MGQGAVPGLFQLRVVRFSPNHGQVVSLHVLGAELLTLILTVYHLVVVIRSLGVNLMILEVALRGALGHLGALAHHGCVLSSKLL